MQLLLISFLINKSDALISIHSQKYQLNFCSEIESISWCVETITSYHDFILVTHTADFFSFRLSYIISMQEVSSINRETNTAHIIHVIVAKTPNKSILVKTISIIVWRSNIYEIDNISLLVFV